MLVKPFLVSGPISMASSSSAQTLNPLEIQQVKSEGFRQFQVERKNFCFLSFIFLFIHSFLEELCSVAPSGHNPANTRL